MKTLRVLGLLLCASSASFGQNFSYPDVHLESVTFGGNNLTIYRDDGSGSYTTPQWSELRTVQYPVAYVSGNTPSVGASFYMECDKAPATLWLRGATPDSMLFPAKEVNVSGPSGNRFAMTYPSTQSASAFASGKVDYFHPFTIRWELSFDGVNWRDAGTSENTLYVTFTTPMSSTNRFQWYHTVYDLSCRNAKDASDETSIIAQVWNEFTDQNVLDFQGDSLHYYKTWDSPNVTLSTLLKYHNGECYTFAQLFLASLKIQGISRNNNYVYITPNEQNACGHLVNRFLVHDWNFGTPSASSTCPLFPFKNTYTSLFNGTKTSYNFDTEDVHDSLGIPGSCQPDPPSWFNNHQITWIDGKYYDPSYGVMFDSLQDIVNKAVSGWGMRYQQSGTYIMLMTDDLGQMEFRTEIETY